MRGRRGRYAEERKGEKKKREKEEKLWERKESGAIVC
jgi:hypothetical protein